ncbi:MAG: class I SAM-dependent methyltransferase [Anaerolineales bacterium]|nr:class I SAM-dependent methyltransferase [Anaerolineales bacterium]
MDLTPNFWHRRYQQQAQWTKSVRSYILKKLSIKHNNKILDVGCGTGVLIGEFKKHGFEQIYGLDSDPDAVMFAKKFEPNAYFTQANGYNLPFPDQTFQVVFCHYLLLWLENPQKALKEMKRTTKTDGYVIAFAEPDYGGRIDTPQRLEEIGKLQTESLIYQGADPFIGRKLPSLFIESGFKSIGYGILGGEWQVLLDEDFKIENEMLLYDLRKRMSDEEVHKFIEINREATMQGKRVLYVPTFYAWGKNQ